MWYKLDDPKLLALSEIMDEVAFDLQSHLDLQAWRELTDELLLANGVEPHDYMTWLADRVSRHYQQEKSHGHVCES